MTNFNENTTTISADVRVVDSAPTTDTADDAQARQRVFALRFRTELCRTHVTTGRCEYRDKCMFAHGNKELRTEAVNEEEGLESDKAIRAWMRERRRVARQRRTQKFGGPKSTIAATAHTRVVTTVVPRAADPVVAAGLIQSRSPASEAARPRSAAPTAEFSPTPNSSLSSLETSFVETPFPAPPLGTKSTPRYRHNPYSLIRVHVHCTH